MFAQLVLALLVVSSVTAQGVWSDWTETPTSACSDTCGYCGVRVTAYRTCSVLGKCFGVAQRYEECAPKMCPFPRKTCCGEYIKGLVGIEFECVPSVAIMAAKTKLT